MMGSILKHVKTVLVHKWFVLLCGIKLGVPIHRLLLHDLSKLWVHEVPGYSGWYHDDKSRWDSAWNHHQKANPHHWEYWVLVTRKGLKTLPMPQTYVREMCADWLAAARSYEGAYPDNIESWKWWQDNFDTLMLHDSTRSQAIKIMQGVLN